MLPVPDALPVDKVEALLSAVVRVFSDLERRPEALPFQVMLGDDPPPPGSYELRAYPSIDVPGDMGIFTPHCQPVNLGQTKTE
jgi:hypothetical protein